MSNNKLFGGVEAGGTKFVCATGAGADRFQVSVEIPTRDAETTLREVIDFFRAQSDGGQELSGLAIGSFGPLELNESAPDYGRILKATKPGWEGCDIRGALARALDIPVAIETDVNAAAIGEMNWGAARDLQHCLYVTVGTGIGVGAIVDGKILHGVHHPEMGHTSVPISPNDADGFEGICPYHQSCVEGLASGMAIFTRWGRKLIDIPPKHAAWHLEAHYLAKFLTNLTFVLQPQRIIIGGGVMNETLLSMIRQLLHKGIASYRPSLATLDAVTDYLVLPELGGRAGVLGALAIAAAADAW